MSKLTALARYIHQTALHAGLPTFRRAILPLLAA